MGGMTESSLAELMQDPLVGLVMKSDGVDRRSIELLFERIGRQRARSIDLLRPCAAQQEIALCTTR